MEGTSFSNKKTERYKKYMVIDYSQTIYRYTELDAYPLPRIDYMVNKISNYSVFTTLDLRSAYHQIFLPDQDKPILHLKQLQNYMNPIVYHSDLLMV